VSDAHDPRLERFARGELDGDERTAFELELAQTPSLREALAALGDTLRPRGHTPTAAPRALQHLTLGRELGRGGMAIVSLAVQPGLEREVAVKRSRLQRDGDDALLVQEARLIGALEHPAIVPVHDLAYDEQGRPLVVLKRVEGEPWSSLLRTPAVVETRFRRPALDWHLGVLCTMCDALAFAHARGVIHRDVKPANVMIGTFGEVYVTDWGLGGLLTRDPAGRLPCVADIVGAGTPNFMAPEQVRLEPLSVATDLWLLGACLYEVLYGRPPFSVGSLEERLAASHACQFEPGPRAELLTVVRRALEIVPSQRFGSALEFKRALEACLRHADSEKLSEEAALLHHLALTHRAEGRRTEADAAATEAAHTLRAALSLWKENEAAEGVATALLTHRTTWALEDDQPAVAQKLLSEAPKPPAPLVERVRQAVDEAARLQKQARGLDPAIGRRQRVTFLLGVVSMMVVFNSARLMWPAFYASRWSLTLSSLAFLVGFVALSLAHRRLLTSTTLNRQLAKLVTFTTLAQLSTRTTAALMGWSRGQALTTDLSVIALTLMIGAGVFHWSFGVGAVVCLAGQALALTFPSAAEPLFGLTSVLAVASVAGGLLFWKRPEG